MMLNVFIGDHTHTLYITRISFKLFSVYYYVVSIVNYCSVLWELLTSYMHGYCCCLVCGELLFTICWSVIHAVIIISEV